MQETRHMSNGSLLAPLDCTAVIFLMDVPSIWVKISTRALFQNFQPAQLNNKELSPLEPPFHVMRAISAALVAAYTNAFELSLATRGFGSFSSMTLDPWALSKGLRALLRPRRETFLQLCQYLMRSFPTYSQRWNRLHARARRSEACQAWV